MKRLGYSILIGAGCALLLLAISKSGFSDLFKKRSSSRQGYYSAELQVAIGDAGNDSKLTEQTKTQLLYRLRGLYTDLSFEVLDKNNYHIKANNILDTTIFKKAITESGKIEFSELFTTSEIYESIRAMDEKIQKQDSIELYRERKLQREKNYSDTATDKLSLAVDPARIEGPVIKTGIGKFIELSPPVQNNDGRLRYAAELGYVKTRDTARLNQLLNDPEITRLFPENLVIVYGPMDVDLYTDDSILKIFAKKNLDKTYFPYPTGDQITNASPAFEPLTGNPMLEMSFDASGSYAWHLMTERNVNRPIAIIANDIVLCAPFVETAIEGGESRITGSFSADETALLSKMVLAGELPLRPRITSVTFKYHSSKKLGLTLIILILFVLSTAASYGISFLIKPASKP